MNFQHFKNTIHDKVLEFFPGTGWDNEEWNIQYANFKDELDRWSKIYVSKLTDEEKIIEWGRDFYQDASFETHDYRVKK